MESGFNRFKRGLQSFRHRGTRSQGGDDKRHNRYSHHSNADDKQAFAIGKLLRLEQKSRQHGAHVSAGTYNSRHHADSTFIYERYYGVRGAVRHLQEQGENEHQHNGPYQGRRRAKDHDSDPFAEQEHAEEHDATTQTETL